MGMKRDDVMQALKNGVLESGHSGAGPGAPGAV